MASKIRFGTMSLEQVRELISRQRGKDTDCPWLAPAPAYAYVRPGRRADDVLDVFPSATIVTWPRPIPAGHQVLLEATRVARFPWLRLRAGFAITGDEDGWRAWLEGWVSPADLALARRLLAGGYGLVTRATAGDTPVSPGTWRAGLAEVFTSSPAQTCQTCGGRRWRCTLPGDVCAACHPEAGR